MKKDKTKEMKRRWKSLLALCLSMGIVTSVFSGVTYPKAVNTTGYISTVEAAGSIKVSKADKTTATKVHKQLYKGRGITLRVKGNPSSSGKLIKKLETKIQKVNKQGVVFTYQLTQAGEKYSYYTVSPDNAKKYMYSVKFIKKLFAIEKNKLNTGTNKVFYQDYLKNKNEQSRMLHTAYDFYTTYLVASNFINDGACLSHDKIQKAYWAVEGDEPTKIAFAGISKKTTAGGGELVKNYLFWMKNEKVYDKLVKSVDIQGDVISVRVMSYSEFSSDKTIKKLYTKEDTWCSMYYKGNMGTSDYKKGYSHLFLRNREALIYGTKNFCDLSQAMQVYAIADSDYFSGEFSRNRVPYCMIYDYDSPFLPKNNARAIKNLYRNNASGVCETFAEYERILFDQLNISNYYNSNFYINHAWSVVKVKNSKGKTLWIPFDYGIGPCDSRKSQLAVSEEVRKKYLSTDKKRYKLYLANIPGAPTKKNFKNTDFN